MSTPGTTGATAVSSTGTISRGRTQSLPGFDAAAPLLQVTDLNVRFPTDDGLVHAVRGVDYTLRSGEVLGIVGESGSGKSVTSLAVMGLLPGSARVTGSVKYRGQELLGQGDRSMSRIRGKGVSMIFQDPMTSLDPVYKVGAQIEETLRIHDKSLSSKAAETRAVELLELVGIPNAGDRVNSYPHEFSGGMRQRVVIAIAMANQPEVIIADEPTTALDVTVQAQILEVLQTALQETGAAMVMITHDLGVVAGIADRVLVMYAGRPVEIGSVEDIYYEPRMPYTLGLLGSLPRLDAPTRERLTPILGSPPSLVNMPPGCPFAPRCPLHIAECDAAEPPLFQVGAGHEAACIRTEQVERAHGHAAEVFSETATDAVLAGDAIPTDLALGEAGGETTAGDAPPPDQTEPAADVPDTGSVISSHRGTTDGDRA
ncbi:Oligopeptide transport protein (ABC superfamily, ATP-binding protein) (modular protein) [Modestobacter italicus]|uniref:Oligopeptide transport protein (ABC superfamily, ATP-binding protein) (Modular protein) n=1 Tax=Modestobacter italicus (strain DSM 44449 / CECT 9708 / BC 501) TaxID=2732864 RepID=I4ET70_MODI5|nr:ABC transporter ATP-binding protein [Modestobacter marinus]CCH86583.1 Oligopeptide transport protein (ABC superfamily, ATP-binding protein) (modular protein) [Modestobacter marinus]